MGALRTVILAAVVSLSSGLPSLAAEERPVDIFAACAGRLSALMEFQWLFDNADADVTEAQRARVLELLEAAMEPGEERAVLALRISVKQAHSVLLSRATFNDDPADAAWAAEQAAHHESACRAFLLG